MITMLLLKSGGNAKAGSLDDTKVQIILKGTWFKNQLPVVGTLQVIEWIPVMSLVQLCSLFWKKIMILIRIWVIGSKAHYRFLLFPCLEVTFL